MPKVNLHESREIFEARFKTLVLAFEYLHLIISNNTLIGLFLNINIVFSVLLNYNPSSDLLVNLFYLVIFVEKSIKERLKYLTEIVFVLFVF